MKLADHVKLIPSDSAVASSAVAVSYGLRCPKERRLRYFRCCREVLLQYFPFTLVLIIGKENADGDAFLRLRSVVG